MMHFYLFLLADITSFLKKSCFNCIDVYKYFLHHISLYTLSIITNQYLVPMHSLLLSNLISVTSLSNSCYSHTRDVIGRVFQPECRLVAVTRPPGGINDEMVKKKDT